MSVKRLEDGRIDCNGIILNSYEAHEISEFIDHECHTQDVIDLIKEKYPEFDANKHLDLVDKIVNDYEHALNNSDEWNYSAEYALSGYTKELKSLLDTPKMSRDED